MNRIVLSKSNFDSESDFKEALAMQLQILIKNKEIITLWCDDDKIFVIEHDIDDRMNEVGLENPYWITPDEFELVKKSRNSSMLNDDYLDSEDTFDTVKRFI